MFTAHVLSIRAFAAAADRRVKVVEVDERPPQGTVVIRLIGARVLFVLWRRRIPDVVCRRVERAIEPELPVNVTLEVRGK